jgi:hypothetical protein
VETTSTSTSAAGRASGALSIDNLDPHTRLMTKISRSVIEPGTIRSKGTATFLITA